VYVSALRTLHVAGLPLDTIALPRLVLTVSFGIWERPNHSVADSGGPGINAVIVAFVDAFYEAAVPFADHPVVVQGTDKDDRVRSRFDGAHELGHLVVTESRSGAPRKSRHKRTNSRQNSYLSAIRAASARGWRRIEPVPLGPPEQPTKLLDCLASPDSATARIVLPPDP
jgi:hypothetical protein